MSTTLVRDVQVEESLEIDINKLVQSASKVIAPYGPISTFAARNPWAGMEDESFEQVAHHLKDMCDVDLMPSDSMLQTAWNRDEISLNFLGESLHQWLNSQALEIPRDVQERFCWSILLQEKRTSEKLNRSGLKHVSDKLESWLKEVVDHHRVYTSSHQLRELGNSSIGDELNHHMIKWCKLFLDKSQAMWNMPLREQGFYQAWRKLAPYDPAIKSIRKQLKGLPKEADQALKEALDNLAIPEANRQSYLEAHLLALPGWAGMMLWHAQQSTSTKSLLTEYLAVRGTMECALMRPYLPLPVQISEDEGLLEKLIESWLHWGKMSLNEWSTIPFTEQKARLTLAYRFDKVLQNRLWLEAWEKTYENQLKEKVIPTHSEKDNQTTALAQLAFCIDVRSEPFRLELEKAGPFETLGTAGFFGLPIETCEVGTSHTHKSLPVMNQPKVKINETIPESNLEQYVQRKQAAGLSKSTFNVLKHNMVSSVMLPEISGPWLTLQTFTRSFIPRQAGETIRKIKEKAFRKPDTQLSIDHKPASDDDLPIGFTDEEKVSYVRQALKTMGLTDNFSPLVVICGHGSRSVNNPYASSLDCGACGGASSGFNARVLASLANLNKVREVLKEEGILIPDDTVFAAAEHITSIDELHWIYVPNLSKRAKEAFNHINAILPKVSEGANAKRMPLLPNTDTTHLKQPKLEAKHRSDDWSEVRPEWGLARNAAFIIGERELTKECNLDGRVFLQNYHWEKDKTGDILANIINGPVTVTQWINLQYYASTVAPHYYGSGDKTTQTVTDGIGVMQGNSSDLLTGLPYQSVMQSDTEMYHEPLRLLVVIQAPREYIIKLLTNIPEFQQKVQNGWLRLASIDPEGNWESWS